MERSLSNENQLGGDFLMTLDNLDEEPSTHGSIDDDGIRIEFGGFCPVQGYGTVDGHPCYYRARGEGWRFELYEIGAEILKNPPMWQYAARPYMFPDGGWLNAEESISNIRLAVAVFRKGP